MEWSKCVLGIEPWKEEIGRKRKEERIGGERGENQVGAKLLGMGKDWKKELWKEGI